MINLEPVTSESEEQLLLRHNRDNRIKIVPVLTRDHLFDRLITLLQHHQVSYRLVNHKSCSSMERETVLSSKVQDSKRCVVVLDPVPANIAHLAAALFSDNEPIFVHDIAAIDSLIGEGISVLLLFVTEELLVQYIQNIITRLQNKRCLIGLLPISDPIESRFLILKSTLIENIHVLPSKVLFIHENGTMDGPPALVTQGELPFSVNEAQLLILSGHSGVFDMSLGTRILCARKDSWSTGERRFPCFNDRYCFRQARLGRSSEDVSNIIGVNDISASVLMLSGCNMFSPGRSWFDSSIGMVTQLLRGPVVGLVCSAGLSVSSIEIDFLWTALLSAGNSIGEALNNVNELLSLRIGGGGMMPNLGPQIVLGNPLLKVSGLHLNHIYGHETIDVSNFWQDSHLGTFVKVTSKEKNVHHVKTHSSGIWSRGVYLPTADGTDIYLWVFPNESQKDKLCELQLSQADPEAPLLKQIKSFMSHLSFWSFYVHQFDELLSEKDKDMTNCIEWDLILSGLRYKGNKMISALSVPPRTILWNKQRALMWSEFRENLKNYQDLLLRMVIACALRKGTLQFFIWGAAYLMHGSSGPTGECICREAVREGIRYRPLDGTSGERIVYACARCGPVGEDDGRGILSIIDFPKTVQAGNNLQIVCRLNAPEDESLIANVGLLIECWRRERELVSQTIGPLEIMAGGRLDFSLECVAPSDSTVGVYSVGILAIINGSLTVYRQMVNFIDA